VGVGPPTIWHSARVSCAAPAQLSPRISFSTWNKSSKNLLCRQRSLQVSPVQKVKGDNKKLKMSRETIRTEKGKKMKSRNTSSLFWIIFCIVFYQLHICGLNFHLKTDLSQDHLGSAFYPQC